MKFPGLRELKCPHVSYKTGTYYFKRNGEDLIKQGPPCPCIHKYVTVDNVEGFKRTHQSKFNIDARQLT
jgi:hypothetical protein